MNSSILHNFETLPHLREMEESLSGKARGVLRRKITKIIKYEPIIEAILEVLDMQRVRREEIGITEDIRPISERTREEYMANLAHVIPYFSQRAFSLPSDYRIPREKIQTKDQYYDFMESLVIQPEYISDDILISLGLMTEEEERSLGDTGKIEKKIALIPQLKQLLVDLKPLRLSGRKSTGRIAQVSNEESPHFGGYIVFQELSDIEEEVGKKRRMKVRKVIPHFFRDHYALLRSQRYAKLGLEKKREFLREIRDTTLPTFLLMWQRTDYTLDEKKRDVAMLAEQLKRKFSYHERRALQDRIEKIDFKNPEHDRQRLIGACNDIIKAIEEKIGKNNEISSQIEWMRDSEKQVRSSFELFYGELSTQAHELDREFKGLSIKDMQEETNLPGRQVYFLNQFIKVVERYGEKFSVLPAIGAPFHRIVGVVNGYIEAMRNHREKRKKTIGKYGAEITDQFLSEMKKIRYEVIMKEAEYRIKVRSGEMSSTEKMNLQKKIERVIETLNITIIPENIEFPTEDERAFNTTMREALTELLEKLREGDKV